MIAYFQHKSKLYFRLKLQFALRSKLNVIHGQSTFPIFREVLSPWKCPVFL